MDVEPPTGGGRRFARHAFVCVNEEACAQQGSVEVQKALKRLLVESGRKEEIRINKSGCLGQCGHGPNIVVYPEGVWYSHVTLADVEAIWDEHMVGGRPVEHLRYRTEAAGTNVVSAAKARPAGPHSSPCTRCPN